MEIKKGYSQVRVQAELAQQVKNILPAYEKKVGFQVSFQKFIEKAVRECVNREVESNSPPF